MQADNKGSEVLMKIKLEGVAETLLTTLYVRAKDAASPHPVLHDAKSAELITRLDYDFEKFKHAWASYYGVLARAKTIDAEIRKFLTAHPGSVVVSVGSGLDTRFSRVDDGRVLWYDLDFPEVIAWRKQLFEENPRVRCIAKSALDPSWTQDVETDGRPLLIVSEGVLMYLEESDVQRFLRILTDGFSEFTAYFDLISTYTQKQSKRHDMIKNMNAPFRWGVKDGSEVIRLEPQMRQIGLINFTDEMRRLLPGWKKLFIPIFYLVNNRLGMYTYTREK